MPKARLESQKRKRRIKLAKSAPFPVPIATISGEAASNSNWIYYRGKLTDNGVMVTHTGDMDFLYRMGFFGKGELSRAQPEWVSHWRVVTLPRQQASQGRKNQVQAKVTSRRRYMAHLEWRLQAQGDDEALASLQQDQAVSVEETAPPHTGHDGETSLQGHLAPGTENTEMETSREKELTLESTDWAAEHDQSDKALDWNDDNDEKEWSNGNEKKTNKISDWGDEEGDADFWGVAKKKVDGDGGAVSASASWEDNSVSAVASWENSASVTASWEKSTSAAGASWDNSVTVTCEKVKTGSGGNFHGTQTASATTTSVNWESSEVGDAKFGAVDSTSKESLPQRTSRSEVGEEESTCEQEMSGISSTERLAVKSRDTSCEQVSGISKTEHLAIESKDTETSGGSVCLDRTSEKPQITKHENGETGSCVNLLIGETGTAHQQDQIESVEFSLRSSTASTNLACAVSGIVNSESIEENEPPFLKSQDSTSPMRETSSHNTSSHNTSDVQQPTPELSSFCLHDHDNERNRDDGVAQFVVADSDDEELRDDGKVCKLKTKWRPVLKVDPFPVKENLQLSYEEAFFLSYGLGCLSVLDSEQMSMDLEGMWGEFCRRRPQFLPTYVAYHYYRSKNWVPKTGLKFGCDLLLYKDGPPFYHGSYSVVVKFVDSEGTPVEGFGERRRFSWTSLAGLKRITEHVGKELLICYVIKPKTLTMEDMLNLSCIPQFQVKEMVVSRWVSSQEREGKALEDMP